MSEGSIHRQYYPWHDDELLRLKGMLPGRPLFLGRPLKVDHGRLCPCPDCEEAREADEIAEEEDA